LTKYDELDPRTELEQVITEDSKRALEKRGFVIQHNGTLDRNAPSDEPDIIAYNNTIHINIEVTKTTKSGADREFLSIKDHLEKSKRENSRKKCFVFYVSPETHYRMMNAIREYDIMNEGKQDLKMMPICFSTFELVMKKLVEAHRDMYPQEQLLALFGEYRRFVDDEHVLEAIHERLFSDDEALKREIKIKEDNKHQKTVEELIRNLQKLEDDLRDNKGIVHIPAIRNIIFLVFMKLYEEKREAEGKENRFTEESFKRFQEYEGQEQEKRAVHILFERIKNDRELKAAKVFTDADLLAEKLDDDFVLNFFIKPYEKYHFYTTKVDGIGAAYEVLGMRTGKDVKAGQFFTPENVVKFMVKLAELEQDDVTLDPACGTGRFLVYSMDEMISKITGRNRDDKIKEIRAKQLYGADYDPDVAKLAKMNMYIHGDGKTNIMDKDGLMLYDFDEKVDVILTNPPLGDQSYLKLANDTLELNRMNVIPKKDVTREKLESCERKLKEAETKLETAKHVQNPKAAKRLDGLIKRYKRVISELQVKIQANDVEYEVRGKQMKGGALFLGAAIHYLKSVRDKSAPIEWRGGKLLIILDEGVLNTDEYSEVREIIKKHFYVKAVISLSRDTFVPVSSTATKTSILYAIKKEDPDAVQQEPIFFAHVEKVGIDTRKRVCANHLFNNGNDILSKYMEFKKKVKASYVGLTFSRERFESQVFLSGTLVD